MNGNKETEKLNGIVCDYYPNGQKSEEREYADNVEVGRWRCWYENGQLAVECNHNKDGELDGPYRTWFENGKMRYEDNYADGHLNGLSRDWSYAGVLLQQSHYKNDQKDGEEYIANKDGVQISIHNYKEGKFDGPQTEYYDTGKIKLETNYKDGELEGKYREYHANGRLSNVGYFSKGLHHGIFMKFDENGDLTDSKEYKNGEEVKPGLFARLRARLGMESKPDFDEIIESNKDVLERLKNAGPDDYKLSEETFKSASEIFEEQSKQGRNPVCGIKL